MILSIFLFVAVVIFCSRLWYEIGYAKGRNDLVAEFMLLWNRKVAMHFQKDIKRGQIVVENNK